MIVIKCGLGCVTNSIRTNGKQQWVSFKPRLKRLRKAFRTPFATPRQFCIRQLFHAKCYENDVETTKWLTWQMVDRWCYMLKGKYTRPLPASTSTKCWRKMLQSSIFLHFCCVFHSTNCQVIAISHSPFVNCGIKMIRRCNNAYANWLVQWIVSHGAQVQFRWMFVVLNVKPRARRARWRLYFYFIFCFEQPWVD